MHAANGHADGDHASCPMHAANGHADGHDSPGACSGSGDGHCMRPGAGGAAPQAHDGHGFSHGFADAEKWAKVFDDPARDTWQRPDEVVALLGLAQGMTVVDLGAGTGYFEGRLSAAVGASGTVIANDLEDDMVRYLGERAKRQGWSNVRPQKVAADDPGLAPASVDRILVVDVWHHLSDRRAYAAKLARALRPGGRVAVVDFELTAKMGPPPQHRLAPEVLAEELRSAGLAVEVAKESLPEQYVVIASRR